VIINRILDHLFVPLMHQVVNIRKLRQPNMVSTHT
jgi:hypothetical protein